MMKWLACLIAGHDWCNEECTYCGKRQDPGPVGIDFYVRESMRRVLQRRRGTDAE